MTEYGDLILKVFHKNDFTSSCPMSWENLIMNICTSNDEESKDLLLKVRNYSFLFL